MMSSIFRIMRINSMASNSALVLMSNGCTTFSFKILVICHFFKLTPKVLQRPNFGLCYFGHVAVIRGCDIIFWEFYGK
jgi:hypothetical protein